MNQLPDLGRYSIRTSEKTLNVGSFWKRQREEVMSDMSQTCTNHLDESNCKKIALSSNIQQTASRETRVGSTDTQVTMNSSTMTSTSLLSIDSSVTGVISSSRDNLESLKTKEVKESCDESNPVTPTTEQSDRSLIIDTQKSNSQILSDNEENSHESIVIDADPILPADSNTSNDINSSQTGTTGHSFYIRYQRKNILSPSKTTRKKVYPKQKPFNKLMSEVIFVMSGYENPRRGKLRDMAIDMGAKYQRNWNRFCTHLICAFKNTPKYKEVMAENGRIVREHWIQECFKERQLLDWRKYKLGKYPYPDSEEEVDVNDLDCALKTTSCELNSLLVEQ